jgi:RNA polymerase sigma-70 factor (ECF subfamily)
MEQVIVREKPPPSEVTDEELVVRVVGGDTEAFALLMRRHNRKVFRAVRSILRDNSEAEDAVQQAYISAYTHIAGFAGSSKFSTWLVRIAINEALGRLRRARGLARVVGGVRESQEQAMSAPTRESTPEEACANRELAEILERAIDELPAMYRTVFMFRQVEGLSTAETAEILRTSSNTVKQRLHRARALLQERLVGFSEDQVPLAFAFDGYRCHRMVARVLAAIRGLN